MLLILGWWLALASSRSLSFCGRTGLWDLLPAVGVLPPQHDGEEGAQDIASVYVREEEGRERQALVFPKGRREGSSKGVGTPRHRALLQGSFCHTSHRRSLSPSLCM